LIGELINAQMHGKQIISTQIAKSLGITRSAVSQMVDRLENQNIVKRVADKVDRKIAYVELTEEGSKLCKNEAKVYMTRVNMLIEKFGEERFKEMCALFHSFCDLVETEK
jgi:DNA-binding MarR family transcriptional regulator